MLVKSKTSTLSIVFQYAGMIESYTFYFPNHDNVRLHFWGIFCHKRLVNSETRKIG